MYALLDPLINMEELPRAALDQVASCVQPARDVLAGLQHSARLVRIPLLVLQRAHHAKMAMYALLGRLINMEELPRAALELVLVAIYALLDTIV